MILWLPVLHQGSRIVTQLDIYGQLGGSPDFRQKFTDNGTDNGIDNGDNGILVVFSF